MVPVQLIITRNNKDNTYISSRINIHTAEDIFVIILKRPYILFLIVALHIVFDCIKDLSGGMTS